jgi:hypothetical protein
MKAAQEQRKQTDQQHLSADFQGYLNTRSDLPSIRDRAQRDELYREFLQWRERQSVRQLGQSRP